MIQSVDSAADVAWPRKTPWAVLVIFCACVLVWAVCELICGRSSGLEALLWAQGSHADPKILLLNVGFPLALLAVLVLAVGKPHTGLRVSRLALAVLLFVVPSLVLLGVVYWSVYGSEYAAFVLADRVWWVRWVL
ncbi:MAG: hypothetical protein JXR37_06865 [Kiritimatiellae bacterium]|nr:hypothetical protein [Kiritimatiellia bacterium]